MSAVLKQPVTLVWLALMAATVASTWWFSGSTVAPTVGAIAVILIAGVKAGFVMSHFMELRRAPLPWAAAGAVWLLSATIAVLVIYLV